MVHLLLKLEYIDYNMFAISAEIQLFKIIMNKELAIYEWTDILYSWLYGLTLNILLKSNTLLEQMAWYL